MPDEADNLFATKSFFFSFQLFQQAVYIGSQRFTAFGKNIPDTTAGQVKLTYLSSEVPDMTFLQPAGHKLHYTAWIVKDDPRISLAFPMAISIHAVVF